MSAIFDINYFNGKCTIPFNYYNYFNRAYGTKRNCDGWALSQPPPSNVAWDKGRVKWMSRRVSSAAVDNTILYVVLVLWIIVFLVVPRDLVDKLMSLSRPRQYPSTDIILPWSWTWKEDRTNIHGTVIIIITAQWNIVHQLRQRQTMNLGPKTLCASYKQVMGLRRQELELDGERSGGGCWFN